MPLCHTVQGFTSCSCSRIELQTMANNLNWVLNCFSRRILTTLVSNRLKNNDVHLTKVCVVTSVRCYRSINLLSVEKNLCEISTQKRRENKEANKIFKINLYVLKMFSLCPFHSRAFSLRRTESFFGEVCRLMKCWGTMRCGRSDRLPGTRASHPREAEWDVKQY